MKLENQVVSLELAKKMEKLGFKKESLWYLVERAKMKNGKVKYWWQLERKHLSCDGYTGEYYSAYTVAELGELLPFYLKEDANEGISFSTEVDALKIDRISIGWTVRYRYRYFSDEKLVDAMAKMLIYLLENKLIKL